MKATRRHELRESDLAQMLHVARDYMREHGSRIGLIVVAAAAAVALVSFSVRSRSAALEDAWRTKDELTYADPETAKESLERLGAMINESSDQTFLLAGLMEQGTQGLRAAEQAEQSPDRELNEMARRAFEQLLERFPDNPLAVGVALCGLATVEENAFVIDGDLSHRERARAHLRAIIDNEALSLFPFARIARDRREMLDKTFTAITFAPPRAKPETTSLEAVPVPSSEISLENLTPITPGAPTFGPPTRKKAAPEQPVKDRQTEPTAPPGDAQPGTPGSDAGSSEPASAAPKEPQTESPAPDEPETTEAP